MPANGRWDLIRRLKVKILLLYDTMFELEAGALSDSATEDAAYFGSTSSRYGVISLAEVRSKISMTMKKKNKKFYFVIL